MRLWGGNPGITIMLDILNTIELSSPDAIAELIKHKANKRKQINYLQELQNILTQKGIKTEEDIARVQTLTSEIRELENQIKYNPLDKVTTGLDIIERVDSLLDIPSFLPTQFKALNRAMGYTDEGGFFRGAVHAIIAASGKGQKHICKVFGQ